MVCSNTANAYPIAALTGHSCLHRLLFYTPPATLVRLLATNATIVWLTSYVLYLSGASDDPRMLLPAWVSIATVRPRAALLTLKALDLMHFLQTLTVLYHLTQRKINIRKETSASINVFSIASFISMSSLLLQLHLTRDNDPMVPLFTMLRKIWDSLHVLYSIAWANVV
ncbi:hypothetical protein MMC22_000835 [Lobaria immixta]|nr:hypothetical protein [Lobaria immixta]